MTVDVCVTAVVAVVVCLCVWEEGGLLYMLDRYWEAGDGGGVCVYDCVYMCSSHYSTSHNFLKCLLCRPTRA